MFNSMITLPTLLAIIGLLLITIEISVLGFGTVFLIFIATGCLLTSLLMYLGLLAPTMLTASLSVALLSLAAGLLLWKPMKRLQSAQQSPDDQPNVFPGLTFALKADLHKGQEGSHRYSGIEWKVILGGEQDSLPAGTEVEVFKTAVGKLYVKAAG